MEKKDQKSMKNFSMRNQKKKPSYKAKLNKIKPGGLSPPQKIFQKKWRQDFSVVNTRGL